MQHLNQPLLQFTHITDPVLITAVCIVFHTSWSSGFRSRLLDGHISGKMNYEVSHLLNVFFLRFFFLVVYIYMCACFFAYFSVYHKFGE